MTNEYPPISPSALAASIDRGRRLRYVALALAANLSIWGIVLFLLKDSPREYTSQWSIMVLGKVPKSASDEGSGSTGATSAASEAGNFKASYKLIATTDSVRKAAAAKVGMTTEQFSQPQVQVLPGTELMTFTITGSTRQEAQKKAYALHEAFQERLNQLRIQQAEEQEAGFENTLSVARKKLESAQFRLSDYKVRAGLASKDQIDELARSIETLRRSRAEVAAQQRDASIRARQLATDLNMSSSLASEAFTLRTDPLFQQYLREYSEATASLANVSIKLGPNHPVVVGETARQSAAQAALLERAEALLGRAVDLAAIARLNTGSGSQTATPREDLFKQIVNYNVERQALAARVQEIDRQIYQLEQRLNILAQRNSTLDALNRDMQIAEAIFSSKLAGLDASSVPIFNSYPPIQMVADPTLPEKRCNSQTKTLFYLCHNCLFVDNCRALTPLSTQNTAL
ncbi:GumC family protein [Leptothermofonsia sp. ETS-13]|uniref:GumC family protein n=1 Tax=Leptothermofonsia sp. ETS-13 TaxID=3035696 RepID=UPI003BA0DE78